MNPEHVTLQNCIETDHSETIYVPKEALEENDNLADCIYEDAIGPESELTIQANVIDAIEQTKTATKKGKICPVCGKNVSQLSKHLPTHSNVRKYRCSYCPKKFAHDSTCKKHIRSVHLKIKNYHCELCSESFADRSSMRYHDLAKHRNEKKFTCTMCDKSYYTSTGLQQHNSLTHEQRKYKCEECGKMFAMKLVLLFGVRNREKITRNCFCSRYHLKEHEKTHSDSRPYVCTQCGRTFKRAKNLNEHLSIHREDVK